MTNHPFESTGMVTNPGKVNRNIKLVSDYAKAQNITTEQAIRDLEKTYGEGLTTFKPILPVTEKADTFVDKMKKSGFGSHMGGAELFEQEYDPKLKRLVGKNRSTGLMRAIGGTADLLGLTDFDERGGGFLGMGDVSTRGFGKRPTDFELPTTVRKTLQDKIDIAQGSTNPYGDIDALVDANLKYQREMDKISRKGRAVDNAMEIANIQAQLPMYANYFKNLSTFKQQQLLDSEFAMQGMPKQEEERKRSSAERFAGEAIAIGNQYGKAVEGAKAGIRNPTATFSV